MHILQIPGLPQLTLLLLNIVVIGIPFRLDRWYEKHKYQIPPPAPHWTVMTRGDDEKQWGSNQEGHDYAQRAGSGQLCCYCGCRPPAYS